MGCEEVIGFPLVISDYFYGERLDGRIRPPR